MQLRADRIAFGRSGVSVGVRVTGRGGWIRFARLTIPWDMFDDSDAWALYSADAKRRAECDEGADEPWGLPLEW